MRRTATCSIIGLQESSYLLANNSLSTHGTLLRFCFVTKAHQVMHIIRGYQIISPLDAQP
jgi:hypothetical protein